MARFTQALFCPWGFCFLRYWNHATGWTPLHAAYPSIYCQPGYQERKGERHGLPPAMSLPDPVANKRQADVFAFRSGRVLLSRRYPWATLVSCRYDSTRSTRGDNTHGADSHRPCRLRSGQSSRAPPYRSSHLPVRLSRDTTTRQGVDLMSGKRQRNFPCSSSLT